MYDLYFKIIPNRIILVGYLFLFPYQFINNNWIGIGMTILIIFLIGGLLYGIYIIGGLGAGDVKLLALICGYIGWEFSIKYLALVFIIGTFLGIFKIILKSIKNKKIMLRSSTPIMFTAPILIAYIVMIILKGGEI